MSLENVNDLKVLRDQMVERRAVQQRNKVASKEATSNLITEVKALLDNYTTELESAGISTEFLHNLDYEKLNEDASYLADVKQLMNEMSVTLQHKLEDLLNVQN